MLEIEQKFAVDGFDKLERWVADRGLVVGEAVLERDCYLNGLDRDFAQTGEAFRLRRVGEQNFFTYKGPKRQDTVKIRTELEVPLQPGEAFAESYLQLMEHLGYRRVAEVRKQRRCVRLQRDGFDVTLTLDEVEGLGSFSEVEIVADADQVERARDVVAGLVAELGLTRWEPRSYLRMVLQLAEGTYRPAEETAP